ncbi:hypothetical protein [Endozoicomonas sp. ALD040]|uniref:hypothetical protein n=1 Tax=unclassified Endozoicomonas TaxID=2644528 RepID=UPI003BAF34B3
MRKKKSIQYVSLILLSPTILWAESKPTDNFRITRDHSSFVEGIEGNVCKAFLEVINRIPEEKLLPCHTPDFSDSPFTLVPFTPLDSKRQIEYGKILYHRDNGTEAYRNAWPEKEKEYLTGYSKLSEAFLDLDGDGVKEHVIEQKIPQKYCIPSIPGKALSIQKKWETLSNKVKYRASKEYGFKKFYSIFSSNAEQKHISLVDNLISYQGHFFSFDMYKLDLRNFDKEWGSRNWITLEKIYKDRKIKRIKGRNACKYWLNK